MLDGLSLSLSGRASMLEKMTAASKNVDSGKDHRKHCKREAGSVSPRREKGYDLLVLLGRQDPA
jgi:hypothetical protein